MPDAVRPSPSLQGLLAGWWLLPIFLLTGCMLQDRLLYYPEKTSLAEVAAQYPGLRPWPAAGEARGFLVETQGAAQGTAVVFHGNAGHAAQRQWYADLLTRLGWRVLLAEYPGYGPRAGKPGERVLVDDAVASLRLVYQQFGAPVIVIGESLGAAVAAGAASTSADSVAALVLITPWAQLANVARHHYPWLPVSLLLQDTYDSAARLQDFPGPIAVVVAQADSIIPAALGRQLFEALPGRKRLFSIPGAEHNDWPAYVDAGWWQRLLAPHEPDAQERPQARRDPGA